MQYLHTNWIQSGAICVGFVQMHRMFGATSSQARLKDVLHLAGDAMQRFHGREAGGAIRDPYDAARRLQREAQREAEAAQVREEADEDEGDEDAEAGNTFAVCADCRC